MYLLYLRLYLLYLLYLLTVCAHAKQPTSISSSESQVSSYRRHVHPGPFYVVYEPIARSQRHAGPGRVVWT